MLLLKSKYSITFLFGDFGLGMTVYGVLSLGLPRAKEVHQKVTKK